MLGTFLSATACGKISTFNTSFQMYASQYLNTTGGRFLTLDTGTGYYKLSIASHTQIDGWAETCVQESLTANPTTLAYFLSSSTSGKSIVIGTKDIYNGEIWFPIPVITGSTIAATNLDQLYDLAIEGSTTTTKQVLDITATSEKVVKVVGMDITNNIAYVRPVQKSA